MSERASRFARLRAAQSSRRAQPSGGGIDNLNGRKTALTAQHLSYHLLLKLITVSVYTRLYMDLTTPISLADVAWRDKAYGT